MSARELLLFYFAHCAEKVELFPITKLGGRCWFVPVKYIPTTSSSEGSAEKEL